MSDTPLTDAVAFVGSDFTHPPQPMVKAAFSQKLERDRDVLFDALKRIAELSSQKCVRDVADEAIEQAGGGWNE